MILHKYCPRRLSAKIICKICVLPQKKYFALPTLKYCKVVNPCKQVYNFLYYKLSEVNGFALMLPAEALRQNHL